MSSILFPRVKSGIPGLDEIIGGGFTKNNLIALSGSTGSGRTTFATQFLINGFKEEKEVGLYLSFDEPKFSIFSNMTSFGWDLPKMEREKQVIFIEYPHNELSSFVEQESSILELIDTLGVERVVFDSITPLASLAMGDERRQFLQKIVNIVRKWGATTIITADDMVPPDPNIPRTSVGIEALTDGYVHLGWIREGMKRTRTFEVIKLRGTQHMHDMHPCIIDSNGFSISTQKPSGKKLGRK
ncbi:MAG: ATPase domain-containing protein [Candidatus Micrarchaeia archaeon]|jgi:KaiC/GvpD/RAD55 family RecA-like ATPase